MSPTHRRSFAEDDTLCDRIFDLLGTWLPVLPRMRQRASRWSWRWEECSTPFVHERDGRVVSHVGVLEMTLACGGDERRVGGIHAVCTLASERRRGLYRELMEEALAWCDERYETLELTTEHPEYYEPFGFATVPEWSFRTSADSPGGRAGLRRLDPDRHDDLALLDDLLERRAPVSPTLGVVREHAVFKFNLAGGVRIFHAPALDAVVALSWDGRARLRLHDVVAPALPSLSQLLSEIPEPVSEVDFDFTPDGLGADAEASPATDDCFMVRGRPLDLGGDRPGGATPRVALSPLARH